MAQYLSKFKIGEVIYNLKDAEVQQKLTDELAKLKAAAYKDVVTAVSESTELPTAAAVKAYVDSQVGSINKFDVVIDAQGTKAGPSVAASADTMYKLYLVADTDAEAGSYVEWITIKNGDTYSWEKIGSTKTDLTGYVENSRKIAGLTLAQDISVADLQGALGLKALAYKDSGSVAITTADSVTMGAYTPAGDVTLAAFTQTSTAATLTKADYTPEGSVNGGKVTAAGSVSAAKAADGARTFFFISCVPPLQPVGPPSQLRGLDRIQRVGRELRPVQLVAHERQDEVHVRPLLAQRHQMLGQRPRRGVLPAPAPPRLEGGFRQLGPVLRQLAEQLLLRQPREHLPPGRLVTHPHRAPPPSTVPR